MIIVLQINLFMEGKQMKRFILIMFILGMTLTFPPMPVHAAGNMALPTSSEIYINGERISLTAYNINGNNYFKLRDLAYIINETEKKFSIGWSNESAAITLKTGEAYAKVGGELLVNANNVNKTATSASAKLFCNDVYLLYNAYNIDGNNYFKLRDILQIMDIGVTWDGSLNSISINTGAHYVYDTGIIKGTSLPVLRVKGNWPMPERSLQTAWAKYYPLYATFLGLPTKILTEGITWEWDDSITPDTAGYYADTNSFKMGRLPQHDNFNPNNYENYEPLYLHGMHETGHLFWQEGDSNLGFDFGQWIWEANSLIAERLFKYKYYGEDLGVSSYDLKANLGWESINGVRSDGNTYGNAGRTMVDSSATEALSMMAAVLSYDTGYDYFARINALRVEEYNKTGNFNVSAEAYADMLDSAANGRTMDGKKPSEWLYSQPVANTDGTLGSYMTILPRQINLSEGYPSEGQLAIETALFQRTLNSNGDKTEALISGINVDMSFYNSTGKLLDQTIQTSPLEAFGTIDISLPNSMAAGPYRIMASTLVDGKAITATSYVLYQNRNLDRSEMAIILLNADGTIKTDIGSSLSVKGAIRVDTSAASKGLIIVKADVGDNITIEYKGIIHIFSKPPSSRIVPLTLQ